VQKHVFFPQVVVIQRFVYVCLKIECFNKANWTDYRNYVNRGLENIPPPEGETDLYTSLERISSTIQTDSQKYIPTSKILPHKPKLPPQYLPLITRSR